MSQERQEGKHSGAGRKEILQSVCVRETERREKRERDTDRQRKRVHLRVVAFVVFLQVIVQ